MPFPGDTNNPERDRAIRQSLRAQEARVLPPTPYHIVSRGVYDSLDQNIMSLTGLDRSEARSVRVLEQATWVFPFGSPTAHDTFDTLDAASHKPDITVIAPDLPDGFKPSYPDIRYVDSVKQTEGEFDIVKAIHNIEFIYQDRYGRNSEGLERVYREFNEDRAEMLRRVREGGLFVSTQRCTASRRGTYGPESTFLGHAIKVLQKRYGTFVPIAFLPDQTLQFTDPEAEYVTYDDRQEAYQRLKRDIERGLLKPSYQPDKARYIQAISELNLTENPAEELVKGESFEFKRLEENVPVAVSDVEAEARDNARKAAAWFDIQ